MTLNQILMDVFDRIYIINLPQRADRRAEVVQQFAKLGLTIDGDRVRFFEATRPSDRGPFPSIGAHGCFMSHLRVLQNAEADKMHSILICEDDLDFAQRLAGCELPWGPALQTGNWDLFYGGYKSLPDAVIRTARAELSIVPPDQAIQTSHCLALKGEAIAACSAYLSAMLARTPGSPHGGPMHVDGAYSWFRKDHPQYTTFATVPAIGLQRSSRSDIAELSWYDRIPVLKQATGVLRRLKLAISSQK